MEKFVEEINDTVEQPERDLQPKHNMLFDNEIDAYRFYNAYARSKGFNIEKKVLIKDHNGTFTTKSFVCSKEGQRRKNQETILVKKPRAEKRIGCRALMGIRLNRPSGKYWVYDFYDEQNHPLVVEDCVHFLPSQREVTSMDSAFIDLTANSGATQKLTFELMGQQAGGRAAMGFTRLDQKNYLRTVCQNTMRYGEAGFLVEYFSKQMLKIPSFYYEMQLDNEEQITNIFWVDAKLIMDYAIFGDVVSFDTTYKINNANRLFAVFVGLNHHRQTVVFGDALMYDETASSFIWLFENFLKAMCGKIPKTFFTDQDAAIAKAISHVMPDTYHRLCIWHLMQNAVKKVGFLLRKSNEVEKENNVFNKFLYQIEEEDEFLSTWKSMLDDYDARVRSWGATH